MKSLKREEKRREIMGTEGKLKQDARRHQAARWLSDKAQTVETIKRVGEYKKAKIDKASGDNEFINRRKQENLK